MQALPIEISRRTLHRNRASRWCLVALWVLILLVPPGVKSETGSIRTLAIGPMGNGNSGPALRRKIIQALNISGRVKVVDTPAVADAELRGTSEIWATGTVVIDPRSSSSRQTNYQGYLSLELMDKQNRLLWSYLVTPSRFRLRNITDDLARNGVSHLLEAIENGGTVPAYAAGTGSQNHVPLRAAGATLPAPLYLKWFESSGILVSYDAIGSEGGIEQLVAGKVDFAASDMPLGAENPPGQVRALQFPTVLGGVVPIYNLQGFGRDLYLTPRALAGIYSGKVRKWNDPLIRETNQGAHLPNAEIAVVHRSDGSGTTFVWTSFLSLVSPEWKTSIGSGTHVEWPAGTGAPGNGGVADLVRKTPNSIGYVELIYAIQHELSYAAVRNPAGNFIKADLASITAAAQRAAGSSDPELNTSILNAANKSAYPISTFTWILVPQAGLDPQKKQTIADLLRWMLTAGQKQCSSLGYPPLPREVAARALQAVNQLK